MVPDENGARHWTFLTNHAQVLVCIAAQTSVRLRDISDRVGITERAAHRIVAELSEAGYITRERVGRRNSYVVHPDLPLPEAVARNQSVGDLLENPDQLDLTHGRARSCAHGNAAGAPVAPQAKASIELAVRSIAGSTVV